MNYIIICTLRCNAMGCHVLILILSSLGETYLMHKPHTSIANTQVLRTGTSIPTVVIHKAETTWEKATANLQMLISLCLNFPKKIKLDQNLYSFVVMPQSAMPV